MQAPVDGWGGAAGVRERQGSQRGSHRAEQSSARQFAVSRILRRAALPASVTMSSWTPQVAARWWYWNCVKQRPKIVSRRPAFVGPCASYNACTRPFDDAPMWFLSSTPVSISFPRTTTVPSSLCCPYILPLTLQPPSMLSAGTSCSRLCRIVLITCCWSDRVSEPCRALALRGARAQPLHKRSYRFEEGLVLTCLPDQRRIGLMMQGGSVMISFRGSFSSVCRTVQR